MADGNRKGGWIMKQLLRTHASYFLYGGSCLILLLFLWLPFYNVEKLPNYESSIQRLQDVLKQGELQQQDAKFIRRSYGLQEQQYDLAGVYRKHSTMDVEEIAIFSIHEGQSIEEIVQGCKKRLDAQIESFAGYGEEQVVLLQNAVLLQNKQMVIMIVHKDSSAIVQLLKKEADL